MNNISTKKLSRDYSQLDSIDCKQAGVVLVYSRVEED